MSLTDISTLNITNDILQLFNGSSRIFIENPWFEIENHPKLTLEKMYTTKNGKQTSTLSLETPKLVVKDDLLLIFKRDPITTFLMNPYQNKFGQFFTKINVSYSDLTFDDIHQIIVFHHRITLAYEYLMMAKLFNITRVTSEKKLYETICQHVKSGSEEKQLTFTEFKKETISLFTAIGLNTFVNVKLKSNPIYKLLCLGTKSDKKFDKSREMCYRYKDRLIVKTLFKFGENKFTDTTRCVVNQEIKPFTTQMFQVYANSLRQSKIVFRLYTQTYMIKESNNFIYAPQIKAVQCVFGNAINRKPEEEVILVSID